VDIDASIAQRLDNVAPVTVRLADKRDIVVQGQIQLAIQKVIAGPLTLNDVSVAQVFVLG
jgi:hypothetical protein